MNDVVIYEDAFDDAKNECYVTALRKGKKKSGTVSKVFFSYESKEYIQDYLESRPDRFKVSSLLRTLPSLLLPLESVFPAARSSDKEEAVKSSKNWRNKTK